MELNQHGLKPTLHRDTEGKATHWMPLQEPHIPTDILALSKQDVEWLKNSTAGQELKEPTAMKGQHYTG